jgi:probable HAF family extracellular repeat protein
MKKVLWFLLSISGLYLLNGCGSSSSTPPPPVATHFSVTSASATPTAGTPFNITVTALDKSGQMVATYSGTVQLTSSNGKAVQPASGTLASGTGTFSVTLNTAGSQTITATDAASLTGTSNSITVSVATSHFSVTVPSTVTTGIAFNITVTALDATNNTVTSYSGTVHFTSTDGQATLPVDSTLANGAGTFSATLKILGNQTITATDTATASVTGISNAISVGSAAPTHLSVISPSFGASPGISLSVSVTALDAANNPATAYSGTIHFTSTDALASLPANSTLTSGTGTFSATLNTVGTQTITATDTVTASITGVSNSIKIAKLTITSGAPPNGSVGTAYGPQQQCYASPGFFLGASGGNPGFHGRGYTWSATSLPPGLQIGLVNYVIDLFQNMCPPGPGPALFIFGTPTQAGTFNNVVITVTDHESPPATASATYSITIGAAAAANHVAETLATLDSSTSHHHYKLIDMGTFGGPKSGVNGEPSVQVINNEGTVVGTADTSMLTPVPGGFNPIGRTDFFISHAFAWKDGVLKELGTLPGGDYSFAAAINQRGQIVGASENNQTDPASGNPEFHAVLWQDDKIHDLGTLGGTASFAATLNGRGQVVGEALNDVPDPLSILGSGDGTTFTQTRAFLWQNGKMTDLGTLGGPDSWAMFVNDRGQIAGASYTSDVIDPETMSPQINPFLWENGKMRDLGNLGGNNGPLGAPGIVNALNNRGQVVGNMELLGDQSVHPFLWDGEKLSDLGSFGGTFSTATGINDAGDVVGYSYFSGNPVKHAVLWRNGVMTDLGTVPGDPCSFASNINSKGQIVGGSQNDECDPFTHAVLWENDEPGVDLNTLISPGSDLQLVVAYWINDRGEIVGAGHDPSCPFEDNCDGHAYVLIPCDGNHPDIAGCDYSLVNAPVATQNSGATVSSNSAKTAQQLTPRQQVAALRARWARQYHVLGAPKN